MEKERVGYLPQHDRGSIYVQMEYEGLWLDTFLESDDQVYLRLKKARNRYFQKVYCVLF